MPQRKTAGAVLLRSLITEWTAHVEVLRRYGAEGQAATLQCAAEELERTILQNAEETLTLVEAAAVSGYSADHLGRLVRTGKLRNVGRKHAPRVRRGDLPNKSPGEDAGASGVGAPDPAEGLFRSVAESKLGGR